MIFWLFSVKSHSSTPLVAAQTTELLEILLMISPESTMFVYPSISFEILKIYSLRSVSVLLCTTFPSQSKIQNSRRFQGRSMSSISTLTILLQQDNQGGEMMMQVIIVIAMILGTQQFVMTLVTDEICFDFYPEYDEKHHEIYFLTAHETEFHPEAEITIYDPHHNIMNSSKQYPHSHYFSVNTKSTFLHKICITRFAQREAIIHFDIIDQEHFQEHSKAGKEDMFKLMRSAGHLNMHLAKFDLTQKSVYQKSRLESLEMATGTEHLYVLTFVKLMVILGVTAVQYVVIRRMYKNA